MTSKLLKERKPLADSAEWTEFMEALRAAKSEPAFRKAIEEFKRRHSG
ncbi:hypothetical protein HYY74_05150 [Candidatus Woesearchaeota archaeon]|nr:hypothetical protein [Candidatus Woesearchaeota archaeon]